MTAWLLESAMVERIGWTLLHSLWQGAAAAGMLAVVLAVMRPGAARGRYLAACAVMVGMVGAMGVTFVGMGVKIAPGDVSNVTVVDEVIPVAAAHQMEADAARRFALGGLEGVEGRVRRALPWVVVGWAVGVLALCVCNVGGWVMLRRMRSRATALAGPWEEMLRSMMQRLRVSGPVLIAQSATVQVPTVIGWLRPLILMPAAAMGGLSAMQIECILAHELAHIRRRDYLFNLLQVAIETLMFYHPAAWWIGRVIRREREHCCDDIASDVVGNRVAYAEALTTMEELRAQPLAMALQGGALLPRIRRLLDLPPRRAHVPAASLSLAVVLVAVIALPLVAEGPGDTRPVGPPLNGEQSVGADVDAERRESVSPTPHPQIKQLEAELSRLEQQIEELQAMRGRNHATVAQARARYRQVQARLQELQMAARGGFFYISGVERSGTYQLTTENGITLKAALVAAGVADVDEKHVILRRKTPAGDDTRVFELRHVLEGKHGEEPVASGDVIMVTRNPQVVQARPERIRILGKVPRPGSYALVGGTLLQALISAGANPPDDPQDMLISVRGGDTDWRMTVHELLNVPGNDMTLKADDTIIYGFRPGEFVYVGGDLPRPGTYELVSGMTLLQMLKSAGVDPEKEPADRRIAFSRGDEHSVFTIRELLDRPAKNITLEAGDQIRYGVSDPPAGKEAVE